MTGWDTLDAELERWQADGCTATFWWRDDDAGRSMPALDRLLSLASNLDAPLGLAVIPITLDDLAVRRIAAAPLAAIMLHGLAHRNHARDREKKSEFPSSRGVGPMLDDLRYGLDLLRASFAGRALSILVPPWNRVAPALIFLLPSIGLSGLSRCLARDGAMAAPGLRQVNCHVDLIDWPGTRGFVGVEEALGLMVRHLKARRTGAVDTDEPTGLLTHHLAHDEACWAFLNELLPMLTHHPAVRIVAPAELFPEAAHER